MELVSNTVELVSNTVELVSGNTVNENMHSQSLIVIVVLKCSKLCRTSVVSCENAVMSLKSISLHFSAFTVFLPIKSTRLVCNLLHFILKITMNCHFLHFSAFTVFLPIKSTRFVCNLLHFILKITMNCHFLHFSAFTVFVPIKSTRLVCNLLHFSL